MAPTAGGSARYSVLRALARAGEIEKQKLPSGRSGYRVRKHR